MKLAQVKKERESERYANDKISDDGPGQAMHSEASALGENKNPEH